MAIVAPDKNFLEQFSTSFEMFSYNNDLYGRLCAHVLLGQILKNVKIYFGPIFVDARISLFFIQPSGTGKSTPWGFIKQVGQKSGLRMNDIDIATDAALVGTEEAEEVVDPETKTKTIVHNVIKGKLAQADVLHYDEGQMLIKRGTYAENTLALFQKALNPIGSGLNNITKNLAHQDIEIEPTCSLIITSHEIENLLDTVLNTGFFQRIVLYPRYVPIPERKRNEFIRCDRFGKRSFMQIDVETMAEKLLRTAQANEKFEVVVNKDVYPVAKQGIDNIYKLTDSSHERVRDIMATFAPRYDNLMYIFAIHHCCAEYKKEVDIKDIKYGIWMTSKLFSEVMAWVEENIHLSKLSSKDQSYLNSAFQIYTMMQKDSNGYVYLQALIENCSNRWRITKPSVARKLERFGGYNKLKRIRQNTTDLVKIEL
jgi:hypothetical protein